MTKKDLKQQIDKFFSDTSRPQSETKEALIELAEHMQELADGLDGD